MDGFLGAGHILYIYHRMCICLKFADDSVYLSAFKFQQYSKGLLFNMFRYHHLMMSSFHRYLLVAVYNSPSSHAFIVDI